MNFYIDLWIYDEMLDKLNDEFPENKINRFMGFSMQTLSINKSLHKSREVFLKISIIFTFFWIKSGLLHNCWMKRACESYYEIF